MSETKERLEIFLDQLQREIMTLFMFQIIKDFPSSNKNQKRKENVFHALYIINQLRYDLKNGRDIEKIEEFEKFISSEM